MATLGLDIGLRGLRAAQTALDTVGHNISNANTPGYTRQRVDLDTSHPTRMRGLLQGTGVETDGIRRITDALLNKRIRSQVSVYQGLDVQLQGMSRIEDMLSEPGGNGLGALFDGFFSSVAGLSANPGDSVLRNSMVQSASSMTDEFQHLSTEISDARSQNLQELQYRTGEVNRLANSILNLNQEIAQAEASQVPANDLRDRREQELRSLSEQVDVSFTEQGNGAILVSVSGRVLVGSQRVHELSVESNPQGEPELRIDGSNVPVQVSGGQVGGLLRFRQEFLPTLEAKLDKLARNMILEVNRAHSTGTPESGGFTLLSGTQPVAGANTNERLAQLVRSAGLPFDVQEGRLYVNMTNAATGEVRVDSFAIDPNNMTVQGLLQSLNGVEHMNAGLDSLGRLNLTADSGYRFDFSARLDSNPNDYSTLGGGRATIGTAAHGPYGLSNGGTLSLQGPLGSSTVTFQSSDFADIQNASAQEIADVINSDAGMNSSGLRAVAVGDRLVLQSQNEGSSESIAVMGGSMLSALGLSAGTLAGGNDNSVQVEAFGRYTGSENRTLYYEPVGDGVIGTTPGLQIRVVSADGSPVAVLDVGEGYVPGTRLSVGEGVEVSFGYGELSGSTGETFKQDWIADSDSSDVLVAFGVNSFFDGDSAGTIEVSQALQSDPNRISYSGSGASGDNGALRRILTLQQASVDGLGASLGDYYGQVVGDVGFRISTTQSATAVAESLVQSLDARREEVSGVNVDEELVNMVRFEQAYTASARYIQTVQQLNDTILSII
ncbi:MAG TPA: flagellar hook-associated protein FlgK [Planctomycetota bacterium]|nr:flagellar hook-associated protein FlgK [Planctomycetota bacterium]